LETDQTDHADWERIWLQPAIRERSNAETSLFFFLTQRTPPFIQSRFSAPPSLVLKKNKEGQFEPRRWPENNCCKKSVPNPLDPSDPFPTLFSSSRP
jgi:hypothetical protein